MHKSNVFHIKSSTPLKGYRVFSKAYWGDGAQSVKRTTPGQEVLGSIPAPGARSLLIGSMSV